MKKITCVLPAILSATLLSACGDDVPKASPPAPMVAEAPEPEKVCTVPSHYGTKTVLKTSLMRMAKSQRSKFIPRGYSLSGAPKAELECDDGVWELDYDFTITGKVRERYLVKRAYTDKKGKRHAAKYGHHNVTKRQTVYLECYLNGKCERD